MEKTQNKPTYSLILIECTRNRIGSSVI